MTHDEQKRELSALLRRSDLTPCLWTQDDEGNWEAGCGNVFVLIEGNPVSNKMSYCPYCGKRLEQVIPGSR